MSDAGDASAIAIATVTLPTPKDAAPALPPDPPPPLTDKASEAPAIETDLLAMPVYATVWDDQHVVDRDLLLTGMSALVESLSANNSLAIPRKTNAAMKVRSALNKLAGSLLAYFYRTGTFPADFIAHANAVCDLVRDQPNMGLWEKDKGGVGPKDYAGLASFLHPLDPAYFRNFMAAKSTGPNKWVNMKGPLRPYFVRERAALVRLSLLTTLTGDERTRLTELSASRLGDEPPEDVELAKLLKEYGSNEVRADDAYKGHVIQINGIAGPLERGTIGGITLVVGTGAQFETPQVTCFFDDSETAKVKQINRGDHVHIRGRVGGLAMNVLVNDCELVE